MVMEVRKHHIILFPFMAQGHISPFLLLAEKIHRKNPKFTITLINTPLNIKKLRSSLPPKSNIHLKSLPFNSSAHGLPPETETTASLPFPLIINLLRASETLQPKFDEFITDITRKDGCPPLCIIGDHFLGWTVEVARKFDIFHSVFLTCGAYGGSVYFSLWKNLPHTKTNSIEFSLPELPDIYIHRSQLPKHLLSANGTDPWSIFVQRQISYCKKSDAMLINTSEEFETLGLSMLRKFLGQVPVLPVGPLLRLSESHSTEASLFQWLDSNPNASVLYVSFGSQNTISCSQMMNLAMGLESSGVPFIWAIRPPLGFDIKGDFNPEWLPQGFEERMREKNQGILLYKWAPQVEILSNSSVGAFLSHCGWNSVLESLVFGVPIIGWPLTGDQIYNSKFLEEEAGVCVEVARGGASVVEKERVVSVIEVVMGE
ncbi:UDP-glycosyltransferase 92A1-like, partial [Asparagus officinalis]|uniref:UDP-glycosyltransferase 92A1-like n=1 Tax=Asparagus officinalis TaxID=4686 RepID=UPI00098E8260